MDWLVEPFTGFQALASMAGDTCSGGGELQSCSQKGALIICTCSGGLVLQKT
jgi:hypothetical protein